MRYSKYVLIPLSIILLLLTFCLTAACLPGPPGTNLQLLIWADKGDCPEIDPYRYFCIKNGSIKEEPQLIELLTDIENKLEALCSSAKYKVYMPQRCDSSIDHIGVILTLLSGETETETFYDVYEAVEYAKEHLEDYHVIDVVLDFKNREKGCARESGREGCAFRIVP